MSVKKFKEKKKDNDDKKKQNTPDDKFELKLCQV